MSTMTATTANAPSATVTLGRGVPKNSNSKGDTIARNTEEELKIAADKGAPDVYVDGENDTNWFLWQGTIYVKPLRFENRAGTYVILLKTAPEAELGKHRHRGEVRAYTVQGSWGYHE